MEENKKNNKLLILLYLFIIISLCETVFIIYKYKRLDRTECTNTDKEIVSKPIDKNKEESTSDINNSIDKYISNNFADNYEKIDITDEYKKLVKKYIDSNNNILFNENEVAVNNSILSEDSCEKYKEYIHSDAYCDDKIKKISYDELLNKKKELYGENITLDKKNFEFGFCSEFEYIDSEDLFIYEPSGCGVNTSDDIIIKKIYNKDGELYIFVNNYNYSDFESPIYTKEFVMIFKKQSSGYYLYDIVSLNYE